MTISPWVVFTSAQHVTDLATLPGRTQDREHRLHRSFAPARVVNTLAAVADRRPQPHPAHLLSILFEALAMARSRDLFGDLGQGRITGAAEFVFALGHRHGVSSATLRYAAPCISLAFAGGTRQAGWPVPFGRYWPAYFPASLFMGEPRCRRAGPIAHSQGLLPHLAGSIRRAADRLLPTALRDADGLDDERRGIISVFDGPPPEVESAPSIEVEAARVRNAVDTWLREGIAAHEIGLFVRTSQLVPRAVPQSTGSRMPSGC